MRAAWLGWVPGGGAKTLATVSGPDCAGRREQRGPLEANHQFPNLPEHRPPIPHTCVSVGPKKFSKQKVSCKYFLQLITMFLRIDLLMCVLEK